MKYRRLGKTSLEVSSLAFGAGPVPAVMTSGNRTQQIELVARAIDVGINWFDTAATYGGGTSEQHLGITLKELGASQRVHVATKVRLMADDLEDIANAVRRSVKESLARLQLPRIALLQLHNSVTNSRGDLPTSLATVDVLKDGGVVDAMEQLQSEGVVECIGFTGLGHAASLHELVDSGRFQTIQIPLHLANPSASRQVPAKFSEDDLGQVIPKCAARGMGVFAIRVYAGGALALQPPSDHTHKTPFFPLALYQRDLQRAASMKNVLSTPTSVQEAALRFALHEPGVTAAIVGFAETSHVDQALTWMASGSLNNQTIDDLLNCTYHASLTGANA
jgi:aryl-alcohol dehydrogenase-like predicted oxidoreductase